MKRMKSMIWAILFAVLLVLPFVEGVTGMDAPVTQIQALSIESGSENGKFTIQIDDMPNMNKDDLTDVVSKPLEKYKTIAIAVMGFGTVTAFLAMVYSIVKLSTAGDNEMARKKAIGGIMTSGVGIALLGGATLVIGFFWNVLKS